MSNLREWICNYDSKKASKISNITAVVTFLILILKFVLKIRGDFVWPVVMALLIVSSVFETIGKKKGYILDGENLFLIFVSNHRILFLLTAFPVGILHALIFRTISNIIFVVMIHYLICNIVSLLFELKLIKRQKRRIKE